MSALDTTTAAATSVVAAMSSPSSDRAAVHPTTTGNTSTVTAATVLATTSPSVRWQEEEKEPEEEEKRLRRQQREQAELRGHDPTSPGGGGGGGGGGPSNPLKRPAPPESSSSSIQGDPRASSLSEKKLRRLEKNRLSARECRRRKREATENLERQINVLEGENLRLRLQLRIGEEAEDTSSREQSRLTHEIDLLLQSGAGESEIYATLEEFKNKYADYGQSRRSAIEFHLRKLERLLMPTQVTSIVMTAIQGVGGGGGGGSGGADTSTVCTGDISSSEPPPALVLEHGVAVTDDANGIASSTPPMIVDQAPSASPSDTVPSSFLPVSPSTTTSIDESAAANAVPQLQLLSQHHSDETTAVATASATTSLGRLPPLPPDLDQPKSLFRFLVQYLEVTPQQGAALKDSRLVAREMDGCLDSALHVLQELRIRLAQTGDDLDAEFNHVRRILTPTQAAKFLVWVARNKACTHMLNELWERVYNAPTPSVPTAAASTTTSTTTTTTENAPSKPHALSQPPKLRQGSFASQTTSSGGDEDEEEEEDDDDEDD